MKLKIKPSDPLSWLAHSAGLLAIMFIIGYTAHSYAAGYATGLTIYYMRECKQEGWKFEFWKWSKLDSVLDFVIPMVVGGIALRYIERIIEWNI